MKYDTLSKVLSIFPDFSTTEPYIKRIEGETQRIFQYYIENCTVDIPYAKIQKDQELLKIVSIRIQNFIATFVLLYVFRSVSDL